MINRGDRGRGCLPAGDAGVTEKAKRAALAVVRRSIQAAERDVAAKRKALKSRGIDVDKEMRRLLR